MSPHIFFFYFLGLSLFACTKPTQEPETQSPAANVPTLSAPQLPTESLLYDVHEWGLIDIYPNAYEIVAGPSCRVATQANAAVTNDMRIGKPVLYFHYVSGPIQQEVRASIHAPVLMETWPHADEGGQGSSDASFAFRLTQSSCGEMNPMELARLCSVEPAPDGFCERAELHHYVANDAHCIRLSNIISAAWSSRHIVGPAPSGWPFLFYRAAGTPLQRGTWRDVTGYLSAYPPIYVDSPEPRPLRTGLIHRRRGGFREIVLDDEFPTHAVSVDQASAWLAGELTRLGLSAGEAAAFRRAWDHELFVLAASSDTLLFFLRDDDIAQYASVNFEPPPRHFSRAFLMRVHTSGRESRRSRQ